MSDASSASMPDKRPIVGAGHGYPKGALYALHYAFTAALGAILQR